MLSSVQFELTMTEVLQKVGFIGLGSMGEPIARRLARRGFPVMGCDIDPKMLEAFDEPGTQRSSDPLETARYASLLGVCVRTDEQLETLVDDGKLFQALGPGGTFILHSTVSPALARSLSDIAAHFEVGFVDVGVSGGAPAALDGQLSLWIGGSEADVKSAQTWLEAIGKQLSHLGPVGRGQEGKLLNNLISIANYGMSTAIVDIGLSMGFDRQQLIDALMAGSAQSFALGVGPRFVQPREGKGATGSVRGLHDLLKKDLEHAAELPTDQSLAMRHLVDAGSFMISRLRKAELEFAEQAIPVDPVQTVDCYFAAVAAQDIDGLMALYADDANFTLPNGTRVNGKENIRDLHQEVLSAGAPKPIPIEKIIGGQGVAVEIETQLPDGSVRYTANHYRFDELGRILSLVVYARG